MADLNITIEDSSLKESAQKFRRELLMIPIIGIRDTTEHMSIRMGIQGKETVGTLNASAQLGPYDEDRIDKSDNKITARVLETFLGNVTKEFSPNAVLGSIYGSLINSGEGLKNVEIAKAVVAASLNGISENLNNSIWDAKRDATGSTTADLFDGFDTIIVNELAEAAPKMSVSLGNLYEFTAAIDSTNAVDFLKAFYRSASSILRKKQTKLFVSQDIYDAYVDDYQASKGALPYNDKFEKTFLEGSNNRCEFVVLPSKDGSKFIQLTDKKNMLVGCDQMSNDEKLNVDRFSAWKLTLSAAMYFGVQYESIDKTSLLVGKLKA